MKQWQIIGLVTLLSLTAIGYSIKDIPINKDGGTLDDWLKEIGKKTTQDQIPPQSSNIPSLCSNKDYATEYTKATATVLSSPLPKIIQLTTSSMSKLTDAVWWEYCNANINFIPKAQRTYDQYGNYADSTRTFPDYDLVKNEARCLNKYFGSAEPGEARDATAPVQLWGDIAAPGEPHSITYFSLSTLQDLSCLMALQLPESLPVMGPPGILQEDLPGGEQMRRWINILYLKKLPDLLMLNLSNYRIKPNLNVLGNLSQLKILSLRGVTVTDYKTLPTESLATLSRLEVLNLSNTNTKDLSPLQGLTELRALDISYTAISDDYFGGLSSLKTLTQLKELFARRIIISDLTPLAQLKKLEKLDLSYNIIRDITPLVNLSQLRELNLSHNPTLLTFNIEVNLTTLAHLTGLDLLDLRDTNIDKGSCDFLKQKLAKTKVIC